MDDNNDETHKSKRQKTECTNIEHHDKESTLACLEETCHQCLKINYCLCKVKCYKRQRNIVHATNAKDIEQKKETLLSNKRPMRACENYRARKNCKFCICYDYFKNVEKKSKAGTTDSDSERRSNREK